VDVYGCCVWGDCCGWDICCACALEVLGLEEYCLVGVYVDRWDEMDCCGVVEVESGPEVL
jgi:hypothetical protein